MKKPILATNIDNLLIAHEAFVEPHKAWFDRAIKKTGNKSLSKWKGAEPYWPGVDEAMKQLMPNASQEKRNAQARTWYQKDVITYIQKHPEVVINPIASKLKKLKGKYRLALITTNTQNYINRILEVANLDGIYDIIVASQTNEEPQKSELVSKIIQEYGIPRYYLSGKPEPKIIELLKEKGVKIISLDDLDSL